MYIHAYSTKNTNFTLILILDHFFCLDPISGPSPCASHNLELSHRDEDDEEGGNAHHPAARVNLRHSRLQLSHVLPNRKLQLEDLVFIFDLSLGVNYLKKGWGEQINHQKSSHWEVRKRENTNIKTTHDIRCIFKTIN